MAEHIIIGGGSGFIGSHLTKTLRKRGNRVTWISRQAGQNRITWHDLAEHGLPQCNAVINLAGQHILDLRKRWTRRYRDQVISSRVETTRSLVDAINDSASPPAVFISTAGKCFYGTRNTATDHKYPELDEYSEPVALDYPAELVHQWEAATDHLDRRRVRHVKLRIGIVLGYVQHKRILDVIRHISQDRGAVPAAYLAFRLGLGATIGHARQPFPWIHLADMVAIIQLAINNPKMAGIYNAVAPQVVSNQRFVQELSAQTGGRIRWNIPPAMIEWLVGKERASILLEGQHIKPRRTLAAGYRFKHPDIRSALSDLTRVLRSREASQ